ncbi:MAG: double-strand break repair protein AddB [Pseudomonadota bacterium]
MFDPTPAPRVYYVPPGVDFPRAVVRGMAARLDGRSPLAWADTQVLGNAGRMLTRLREVFAQGPTRLLPRLSLVTDIAALPGANFEPTPPEQSLRRQLDLEQLIRKAPGLSAPDAAFDVARSLMGLLDEMGGEGVGFDALARLSVEGQSAHWERALAFVRIAAEYEAQNPEATQRARVEALVAQWALEPPQTPILVAGSTASRGTTRLLMRAIAQLPQGALILPGFDPNLPQDVWAALMDRPGQEDHPQQRYASLVGSLGLDPCALEPWDPTALAQPERGALISLALRPAPVTDHWLRDGPKLADLGAATAALTLVEAQDQRAEADAIALRLRAAAVAGERAALITPDRTLTRRVAAALDRWGLAADDSAGVPLSLTAPGRLLGQIARLGAQGVAAGPLIAILKHPLVATGAERGTHLLVTRALELRLRRKGPPFPTADDVLNWAAEDDARKAWGAWLAPALAPSDAATLAEHIAWLRATAETLCAGPDGAGTGALWEEAPGRAALQTLEDMAEAALPTDVMRAGAFAILLGQTLSRETVTIQSAAHPLLNIWGTLEARAQGAEVVILGGLNDGVWPPAPSPDPWMNRAMRAQAGLLSPERQIGLSAHDFEQAANAAEVWFTRATKSDDAETVPSRWLNRLTTLLDGLSGKDRDGKQALAAMRARGQAWLDQAGRLDVAPRGAPAPRPSPVPPRAVRPKALSVTEIKTLIRDPYAIYAKHVLRLRELDPLDQTPDARLRGTVIHKIMEEILAAPFPQDESAALAHIERSAERVLARVVPWPAARALWKARLMRVAPWFVRGELRRGAEAQIAQLEARGAVTLDTVTFTLRGTADRIDLDEAGHARIYDYKTGAPPSEGEQRYFDKQLHLEAAMMERGGFEALGPNPVARATYIGLGSTPKEADIRLDTGATWSEFTALIAHMLSETHGFTARRAMQKDGDAGPYDLLSRYGEWGPSDAPVQVVL